jgi:hypothetical protein
MAAIGRKGGQIGGKRRRKTMTKEQRRKIAAKAARARWKKTKPLNPSYCPEGQAVQAEVHWLHTDERAFPTSHIRASIYRLDCEVDGAL